MGLSGFIVLLAGAIVLGIGATAVGGARYRYEWLITTIAAAVGAYIGSALLGSASTWGPALDGLFVLPALIGAVLVGGAVELITRSRSSGPAHA